MVQNQNITAQSTGDSQNHRIRYFGLFDFKIMGTEIWKDITGLEGEYQVGNSGKVKSLDRYCRSKADSKSFRKGIIRKQFISNAGYYRVSLKGKYQTVHRLVAIAFVDNPENKPEVNHKNGIKTDNRAINLGWCTKSENMYHAYRNGATILRGSKNSQSKIKESDIPEIRKAKCSKEYRVLADKLGVTENTIYRIATKREWKHI